MTKANIREEYHSILVFEKMAMDMVLSRKITKRRAIKLIAEFKGERMKNIRSENDEDSGWNFMDDDCRYRKMLLSGTELDMYLKRQDKEEWNTTNMKVFPVNGNFVIFHFQQKIHI